MPDESENRDSQQDGSEELEVSDGANADAREDGDSKL